MALTRRLKVRIIVGSLVIVTIALGTGVGYLAVHGVSSTDAVGGQWQIESREFLAGSHRAAPARLYRASGGRTILVDDYVSPVMYRYYGDDCLVYVTGRGAKHNQYYAVCGDHQPVLLAAEEYEEWVFNDAGIQKLDWIEENGKMFQRRGLQISVADIKQRAMEQPRLRDGWQGRPPR